MLSSDNRLHPSMLKTRNPMHRVDKSSITSSSIRAQPSSNS